DFLSTDEVNRLMSMTRRKRRSVVRDLIESRRTCRRMTNILSKESKIFKDKIFGAEEFSQTIELNKLRTPAKTTKTA
ncbi:3826_t:CDS:2, partial [Paraglomus brasilianum]